MDQGTAEADKALKLKMRNRYIKLMHKINDALGACPRIDSFAQKKDSNNIVEHIDPKALSQLKYDDNKTQFFNNNNKI